MTRLPLFSINNCWILLFNNYYSEIKETLICFKHLELLITGDFYLSGSLMARLDQVIYAIDTNKNVLIGWGLGREHHGSITLHTIQVWVGFSNYYNYFNIVD